MSASEERGHLFLIDDHPAVRQGLRLMLSQQAHRVCGEAGSVAEALSCASLRVADVALLDLSLGDEDGLTLLQTLHQLDVAVLVYSMFEDAETVDRAFRAGVDGYVSKRESVEVLLKAIGELLAGRRFVSPRAALGLLGRCSVLPDPHRGVPLSEQEKRVLTLLGEGESNLDIAQTLHISVRTLETHCARIISKLDLSGMRALRRHAIQQRQHSVHAEGRTSSSSQQRLRD